MDCYTTNDLKAKIDKNDAEKLAKEEAKVVISNDTYAIVEAINSLRSAIR